MIEAKLGPGHEWAGHGLLTLAQLEAKRERQREAEAYSRRALAVWEKGLDADHPLIADALAELAAALAAQGRSAEAAAALTRAVDLLAARQPAPPNLGELQQRLASLRQTAAAAPLLEPSRSADARATASARRVRSAPSSGGRRCAVETNPGRGRVGVAAGYSRPFVGHDVLPLAGVGAGDDGHHRLAVAQVEDLVRHAGGDEDEVAGLVVDALAQAVAVLVAHAALEDVEHHLEADVNVGAGDAAGRDGGEVHRQLLRADVLGRQPGPVADAVPAALAAAAAQHGDAAVVLDVAAQLVGGEVVDRQCGGRLAHGSSSGRHIVRA